ncbi:rRNA-processing protein FCF1 -like protein [Trichinella papuae]|uniref:rRNA-processing protein FCF1-like protein n=1 Tax=Trichinella papuae TaxID=268474 RepID=A0A0V1MH23_9BILA|nr:rRNA-processing protein FCF1 -like protein [Trichinella papuae]
MPKVKRFVKTNANKPKLLKTTDNRINPNIRELKKKKAASKNDNPQVRELPRKSAALFLQYNEHLGPPYHVILDTNFINFSIKNKLDIVKSMTDCLYAKCVPYITDCVLGELEKMGTKFKLALRVIKDPRFERLVCLHKGTYADDCIVQRVTEAKCYIVATCDKDLKRRIRKIPGIPLNDFQMPTEHLKTEREKRQLFIAFSCIANLRNGEAYKESWHNWKVWDTIWCIFT